MVIIKAISILLLPLLAYAAPVLNTDDKTGLDVANVDIDDTQALYARDETTYDIDPEQLAENQKRDSFLDDIYHDIQARQTKTIQKLKPVVITPVKPTKTPGVVGRLLPDPYRPVTPVDQIERMPSFDHSIPLIVNTKNTNKRPRQVQNPEPEHAVIAQSQDNEEDGN